MTKPTELPADVTAYLEHLAIGDMKAQTLVDKYTPTPETLADYGTITYTRRFRHEERWENVEHLGGDDDRSLNGLHVRHRDQPISSTHLVPWPDDGGICDLLNDGWRLVRSDELDTHKHEVLDPTDGCFHRFISVLGIRDSQETHYVLAREMQS